MTFEAYLTTKEVAIFLGVKEQQVRNWTSEGKLPFYKLGRLNRYKWCEIKEIIDSNPAGLNIIMKEKKNGDKER